MNGRNKVCTATYEQFFVHGQAVQLFRDVILDHLVAIFVQNIVSIIVNEIPNGMEVVVDVIIRILLLGAGFTHILPIAGRPLCF